MFNKKPKTVVVTKDGEVFEKPNNSPLKKIVSAAAILAAGAYIYNIGKEKGYKQGAADMKSALTVQNTLPEDDGNENKDEDSE